MIAAVFFLGQGGYLFSSSFAAIADEVEKLGITTITMPYTHFAEGTRWLTLQRYNGAKKLAACGYSRGVEAATYIQASNGQLGGTALDLLISVAPSTLVPDNQMVNHNKTKRSRLFVGTDFLSSDGQHDGYDEITHVTAGFGIPIFSHLLIPAQPIVINGILDEFNKLKDK